MVGVTQGLGLDAAEPFLLPLEVLGLVDLSGTDLVGFVGADWLGGAGEGRTSRWVVDVGVVDLLGDTGEGKTSL